jgi:hypothetical protein
MNSIDKFLKEFSYKFPKGYPDMNNEQDILLLESILESLGVKFKLNEADMNKTTAKVIDKIISSEEGKKYNFKKQTDPRRLANLNKISPDEFKQVISTIFDNPSITIYKPGEGPNVKPKGSTKFSMYEFNTELGPAQIILSGGANEGEKYETDFIEKLKSSAGKEIEEIPYPDVVYLLEELKIDPKKLTPEDIIPSGRTDTKRSLNLNGPENVGSKIADFIIKYKDKDYNISLKNVSGSGFYNGGNVPFIVNRDGKAFYDKSKEGNTIIDEIFEILNIDTERIIDGINEYIDGEGNLSNSYEEITSFNKDKIQNLLSSGFGYGYYYVRQKPGNKLFIYPVLDEQDAKDLVGDVKSISIKYPNKETKSVTLKIFTNSPVFGEITYLVEVRNTQGNILPLAVKMKLAK